MSIQDIRNQARKHANNLQEDIKHASTRIEHIRLTTLALEAARLADNLDRFSDGVETAATNGED